MVYQIIGGIAIIIIFVLFAVPTIDVLTINVNIPPTYNDITLLYSKVTVFQQYTSKDSLQYNKSLNDVAVDITLKDSSNKQKFNRIYYLESGTWRLNTLQPISNGDIVTVKIPAYGINKVIVVGR